MFTSTCHQSLTSARCNLSTHSHPISLRSSPTLSFHLHKGLSNGHFPSGFPTRILYAFLISPLCATYPTHLTLHDMITLVKFGNCTSIEVMKLLIMQSSPASHKFLPLRSKYFPQHPDLKHPHSIIPTV